MATRQDKEKVMRGFRFAFVFVLLFSFLAAPIFAAGHSALLNWTAPSDATVGTTYSVYRMSGACPATPGTAFTLLASGVTTTTYTDATVTVGTWCYYVEQVQNSTNSVPSNLAGGTAAPFAATITVTVN